MSRAWTEDDERELSAVRHRHEALVRRRDAGSPGGRDTSVKPVRALTVYQARRLRRDHFPGLQRLLGEPAWDILLDLHAMHQRRRAIPVSSVCAGADAPTTTALRVLGQLERLGLVERSDHPTDRRTSIVALSGAATGAMDRYLERVGHLLAR